MAAVQTVVVSLGNMCCTFSMACWEAMMLTMCTCAGVPCVRSAR